MFYDFNEATDEYYLSEFHHNYDIIIADPPFLSEECVTKMCKIINKLLKESGKVILCSGKIVEPWVLKHLNLFKCKFRPGHERNLGNEFVSYANFSLDELICKNDTS